MIVSVTERGVWRRCHRRWDYSSLNRQALAPLIGAPNLSLGSVIHKTLDRWATAQEADPNKLYIEAAHQALERVREKYYEIVGAKVSDGELSDTYEALALGKDMIANYYAFWKVPVPVGFKVLGVEKKFVTPIPGMPGCSLGARLDGVLEHEATGTIVAWEHKTYKNRPNQKALKNNDQLLAYCWVLAHHYPGRKVGGVLYNGLWKRAEPPRKATLEDLFLRIVVPRTEIEFPDFERSLIAEFREMTNPSIADFLYPNRRWEGCWDCGFNRLCELQSRAGNWELYKETNYMKRDLEEDNFPEELDEE